MRRTVAQPERVLDGGGACALLAEAVEEVLAEVVEGELLYLLQLLFFHVDRVLRRTDLKQEMHVSMTSLIEDGRSTVGTDSPA